MMKRANNYWERRFALLKDHSIKRAELEASEMRKLYASALEDAQKEVMAWYSRYAEENKMTLRQARKQLDARELAAFRMTLKDYIELAQKENLSVRHIKMLQNASIRARLDRSQALYIKLAQSVERLAKTQDTRMHDLLAKTYKDSYYKTAYETQKATDFTVMPGLKDRDIDLIVKRPWTDDGVEFSERIWKNRDQLASTLQTEITRGLLTQKGSRDIASNIAEKFDTSYFAAKRLIETETAHIHERAMLDSLYEMDIEEVEITAVLDTRTSATCQDMDGKKLDMKDAKPGITTPPFHCYCRSTIVPVIGIEDEEDTRVARDVDTGKSRFVRGDLTYKKWYDEYVGNSDEPASMLAGVQRGKPMSFEEADSGRPNPNYGKDKTYSINCQTCVVAYEARRRGYNVEAIGNNKRNMCATLSHETRLAWIDKKTGKKPEYIYSEEVNSPAKQYAFMQEIMEEGKRYTVQFRWKGRDKVGHIIHTYKDKGEIVLYDPQVNSLVAGEKSIKQYFRNVKFVTQYWGLKINIPPKMLAVSDYDFNKEIVNQVLIPSDKG